MPRAKKEKRILTIESLGGLGDNDFLSAREAADCLGVYYVTFLKMLKRGDLPFWQFSNSKNSSKKIKVGDLKAFFENSKRQGTQSAAILHFAVENQSPEPPPFLKNAAPQSADNSGVGAQIAAPEPAQIADNGGAQIAAPNSDYWAMAEAFFGINSPKSTEALKKIARELTEDHFDQKFPRDWRKEIIKAVDNSGRSPFPKIKEILGLNQTKFKALYNQNRIFKQAVDYAIKIKKSRAKMAQILKQTAAPKPADNGGEPA